MFNLSLMKPLCRDSTPFPMPWIPLQSTKAYRYTYPIEIKEKKNKKKTRTHKKRNKVKKVDEINFNIY